MVAIIVFIVAAGILGLLIASSSIAAKKRKEEEQRKKDRVYAKYGRTEIAERILNKTVWVGETAEQLRDSFGSPLDIDEKVLKTKKKEVWKYIRKGANRYGLKFTLENDVVVGWDEKL